MLVVMVVLVVMALVAMAAMMIASRDREAASAKGKGDALRSCAQAAARKIFAEMAVQTDASLVGGVWATGIPGGPRLDLGHYDQNFTTVSLSNETQVKEQLGPNSASGGVENVETGNTFRKGVGGSGGALYVAHCTDAIGRQYEVELFARIGL